MAHSIKQCFHAVGKGTLYTGQIKNMSNNRFFVPAIFVQCVTPSKNHPHPDVMLDIEKTGCTVQYANRISEYNF